MLQIAQRLGRGFRPHLLLLISSAAIGSFMPEGFAQEGFTQGIDLLEPGPLTEKVIGKADAPVTIIEYASMTCHHCAAYHTQTLPELKRLYMDTGRVRYIIRGLATDPRAEAALMLAYCSGDNYFALSDLLYRKQSDWAFARNGGDALLGIARIAGFSQESFTACLTDRKLLADVRRMRDRGLEQYGITAAPTFFINGVKHSGAMSIEEMSAIIDGIR